MFRGFHVDGIGFSRPRFRRDGHGRTAPRAPSADGQIAIAAMTLEKNPAARLVVRAIRAQHQPPGTVSKEDTGVAVLPVDQL